MLLRWTYIQGETQPPRRVVAVVLSGGCCLSPKCESSVARKQSTTILPMSYTAPEVSPPTSTAILTYEAIAAHTRTDMTQRPRALLMRHVLTWKTAANLPRWVTRHQENSVRGPYLLKLGEAISADYLGGSGNSNGSRSSKIPPDIILACRMRRMFSGLHQWPQPICTSIYLRECIV